MKILTASFRSSFSGTQISYFQKISQISNFRDTNKRQPHKMVKHTKTIRRVLPATFLSVFDRFVGLALKGLNLFYWIKMRVMNWLVLFYSLILQKFSICCWFFFSFHFFFPIPNSFKNLSFREYSCFFKK